ncbi:MAG: response regulator [Candidatus Latescibacteria bacterium]|nr:response regulator [bacterium]MBD3424724.1 response regulator [Candidatus Latescibacterota bacterium]
MARIIVIDDDRQFVELAIMILRKSGYEVVSAFDCAEGSRKVLAADPDVIILDLMIGGLSQGFDLAGEIRRNGKTARIPLILLTMVGRREGKMDSIWISRDQFITKPVKPELLLEAVDRALERKGS